MNLEPILQVSSLGVSLIALGTVVFHAGKYSEKVTQIDKVLNDFRIELDILPTKFAVKEMIEIEMRGIKDRLTDIKGTVESHNASLNTIMIQLGKLEQKRYDDKSYQHPRP